METCSGILIERLEKISKSGMVSGFVKGTCSESARMLDQLGEENQQLRKSADAYKEAAEVFQRKAYEEQKQREELDVENQQLKSDCTRMVDIDGEQMSVAEFIELAKSYKRAVYNVDIERLKLRGENQNLKSQLKEKEEKLSSMDMDLTSIMWSSGEGCKICAHAIKQQRGEYIRYGCDLGIGNCKPEWRGNKEAE